MGAPASAQSTAQLAACVGRQLRQGKRRAEGHCAHAVASPPHITVLQPEQQASPSPEWLPPQGKQPKIAEHVRREKCQEPGEGWHFQPHHHTKAQIWESLKREAQQQAAEEPVLASHLHSSIIMHSSLEESLAFVLANKLSSPTLLPTNLMQLILKAYHEEPDIVDAAAADMQAVLDRDPACFGFLQIMLYFKGFQAIQTHRISHYLWATGRVSLAYAIQSRMSQQYDVDVHPGAYLGRGIMMDHATGVVIGETAVIGDNVSMLHRVTIGGSGTHTGIRHPSIGHGVLLGAGCSVLGPISIGHSSKIGACSVVLESCPEKCVIVGVPAKIVKQDKSLEPCKDMDCAGDFVLDFVI